MSEFLSSAWRSLPAGTQDLLVLGGWLLPSLLALALGLMRYRTGDLVHALLRRHLGVTLIFVMLIALASGLGLAIDVQERGIRAGTAGAADRFDLLITAPGNDTSALLAAVYLQPAQLPLLSGRTLQRIADDPAVAMAAPLALGDSIGRAPMVGTTTGFVRHLIGIGPGVSVLDEGRLFKDAGEAVVGATVALSVGQRVSPSHGIGSAVTATHDHVQIELVGRLPRTGTPWDNAVIVPVETVWLAHGLGDGHAGDAGGAIGPPFDPVRMPGVPAVVVRADSLGAYYALRERYTDARTMAFFPAEVLTRLYRVLGDVRRLMTLLSSVTQVLVVIAIGVALSILLRGLSRRFAMLRALGAPRRFVFALVWCHATILLLSGALLGIGVGVLAAFVLAERIAATSGVHVPVSLSVVDLSVPAMLAGLSVMLSALPAAWLARRPIVVDLRG